MSRDAANHNLQPHLNISFSEIKNINKYIGNEKLPTLKMNRIKQVLEEKELTQTWLSKKLGKSYNMVNSYAQNRRQPSIKVLYKIAELLSIEAGELLIKREILKK